MSFVKPFAYLYEESDAVIKKGTIIPEVNLLGKTPDEIVEQVPIITPPLPQKIIIPIKPVISEQPVVVKPVTPQVIKPGRKISISVEDDTGVADTSG